MKKQYKTALLHAMSLAIGMSGFTSLKAQSTIFKVHDRPAAEGEEAIAMATPQERRGPQLDVDRMGNPIVTFKAANNGCEAMALMPSADAIKDGVKLRIVHNNRLPINQKWVEDTKVLHQLPFTGSVRVDYGDDGTTVTHGGMLYRDTNHNYGYRLVINNEPIKSEADYLKYIRHGFSTAVPFDISKITLNEAEELVDLGDLSTAFNEEVLQPLKQKIAENESWTGAHKGFQLVMIQTATGQEHGIDGSLDNYLTNRSDCKKSGLTQSGNVSTVHLK